MSVQVNVLVADDHIDSIDDVAAALGEAGLRLGQTLPTTGVITGSVADHDQTDALRKVAGVASVEVSRDVQLPPPDSPVQ